MPATEQERMLRYTWRDEMDDEQLLATLEVLGETLVRYAREAHEWGGSRSPGRIIHGDLESVCRDLDSMAASLREIGASRVDGGTTKEELALIRRAPRWAAGVDKVVGRIRAAVNAQGGLP